MASFNYTYDDLFNPLIKAMKTLGGSGGIAEMEEAVSEILNLSDEQINDLHRGNRTKLSYRLAWARTYLKNYGLLENSSRGVWALTEQGQHTDSVDSVAVSREVKTQTTTAEDPPSPTEAEYTQDNQRKEFDEGDDVWRDRLLSVIQKIEPDRFERLCQRMLRELGFINVEVTGKSGDGGIDGKGIISMGSVLSFQVVFQCKRYQGSVSSSTIRDFRGAMIGRADRGLVITTGTFTHDARKEAQRDGAPTIDLMDGYELVDKLKELRMGVEVYTVEKIKINEDWFRST